MKSVHGFLLIELVVVLGLIATISFFITLNLLGRQRNSDVDALVETVISDIRQQQIKAMVGYAGTELAATSYGIRFENSRYILFQGDTYDAGDLGNTVISVSPLIITNIAFDSSQVVFDKASGEIRGYSDTQDSIQVQNPQNAKTITIELNRFGSVSQRY